MIKIFTKKNRLLWGNTIYAALLLSSLLLLPLIGNVFGQTTVKHKHADTYLVEGKKTGGSTRLILDVPADTTWVDSCVAHGWELRDHFPCLRKEVKTGRAPKSCFFSPDGRFIAVCLLSDNGIDLFDAHTLAHLKRIRPPSGTDENAYVQQEYFWGYAEGRFLDTTGDFWFTRMTTGRFFIYDPLTDSLAAYNAGGSWTKVVSFSPDRRHAAFSHWLSNTVTLFDTRSRQMLRTIRTGKEPRGIAWIDEETIAVALYGTGDVQIFHIGTGRLIHTIMARGGYSARDVCFDPASQMLYFSDSGRASVRKYDWAKKKMDGVVQVDLKPNSIRLTPDGAYLFVSCRGPNNPDGYTLRSPRDGSICLVRTDDFHLIKRWTAGNQPTGLAVSPDGNMLACTDFQDRRLSLYLIARQEGEQPSCIVPGVKEK